jgi:hypothetical protein
MESDYNWFATADLSEFSGKWVAILNKKVIASDENPRSLANEVKEKYPKEKPLLAKINNKTLIL